MQLAEIRSQSCEKFTVPSKSIAGQPPNNSLKPTPLRSGHAVAEKACHGVASTTLRVLAQALAECRQAFSRSRLGACTSRRCSSNFLALFCHQLRKSGLPALDVNRFRTRYVIFGRAAGAVPRLHTQLTIHSSRARFAVSVTPGRIGRAGLIQALGLASEGSVTRATPRGLIALFRAVALALHPSQLTFGSSRARPARFHQAVPVSSLASPLGSSRFARRRTRQQALPRVPACECEIFTKALGAFRAAFAGKSKGWTTA